MALKRSFRFANPTLNRKLQAQLRTANVKHAVESDGSIHYSTDDEERIENEFLGRIRGKIFSSWQLVFCPPQWAARYQAYMGLHKVPFEEQWIDEQPCFLIPRRYRPHTWKLADHPRDKQSLITARSG